MSNYRTLHVKRSTSTAHRLTHYDGVCGNIHGHNLDWDVTLEVSMEGVGEDNMPVDFKDVSEIVDECDHTTLLNENDKLLHKGDEWAESYLGSIITFDSDPTCEHVAQWMATRLVDELDAVAAAEVTVAETDKYSMTARANEYDVGKVE